MAGFIESGITLDFPTEDWFRFERTEPHKSISCFNFKEMDACWIDYEDKKFYAIELKDYTATGSLELANSANRKWNITKKVIDTMQMFLAAKYQSAFGQILESEKNVDLHSSCLEAYFITIINVAESSKGYMGAFKDDCLKTLKGYTKVWDNAHVTVMTYEQAKQRLPFVK